MDENSYRFWSTVGIWVTPLLTAIVAAGAVLLATRWEAGRAERRAQQEAQRRAHLASVESSFEGFVEMLIEAANALADPKTGIGPVRLLQNAALFGDVRLAADWVSLLARLAQVAEAGGKLDPKSRDIVGNMQVRLQAACTSQISRIVKGLPPKTITWEEIKEALPDNDPGRKWVGD
jgi:hypothetical protein